MYNKAEQELNLAFIDIKKCARSKPSGIGYEKRYQDAYQKLARMGEAPKLRAKYQNPVNRMYGKGSR